MLKFKKSIVLNWLSFILASFLVFMGGISFAQTKGVQILDLNTLTQTKPLVAGQNTFPSLKGGQSVTAKVEDNVITELTIGGKKIAAPNSTSFVPMKKGGTPVCLSCPFLDSTILIKTTIPSTGGSSSSSSSGGALQCTLVSMSVCDSALSTK